MLRESRISTDETLWLPS